MLTRTLDALNVMGDSEHMITVRPKRTTRAGGLIEYASLNPPSAHSAESGTLRRRRSLEPRNVQDNLSPADLTADGDHEVFYDIGHAPGSPLSGAQLHLKKNYKLLSQNFLFEERSRGGKIKVRHSMVEDCHYKGVIRNHDKFSRVAISLCNGLVSAARCTLAILLALSTRKYILAARSDFERRRHFLH